MSEREIIPYISSEDLDSATLDLVCANEEIDLYWSDEWSVQLYCGLAEAGFISTSFFHEELGELLLPEIQHEYAVLDWENLHISRKIRKTIKSTILEDERFYLAFSSDLSAVADGIERTHEANWLTLQYRALLETVGRESSTVTPVAVELRHGESERLAAGEIGYIIGAVYISLSGFCERETAIGNLGTIQLIFLAKLLEKYRFEFWNLGHPHMEYKRALGANIISRGEFLERWKKSISSHNRSQDLIGRKFSSEILNQ